MNTFKNLKELQGYFDRRASRGINLYIGESYEDDPTRFDIFDAKEKTYRETVRKEK